MIIGEDSDALGAGILRSLADDPRTFFASVRRRVLPSISRYIAAADHGDEFQANLDILNRIVTPDDVPSPLGWSPKEVLELTRWEEPSPEAADTHVARLFACSILTVAAADPANQDQAFAESLNETLAPLIHSVLCLGDGLPSAAVGFLAHCGAAVNDGGEAEHLTAFFALGLLILLCQPAAASHDESVWRRLVEFVMAEDRRVRAAKATARFVQTDEFVLGLTNYNQRHPLWRDMVLGSLGKPPAHLPPGVRDDLRLVAASLRVTKP